MNSWALVSSVWRKFKQQAFFRAESSVQAKYRHLGNLCIQNPSYIWNIKHIKFSVSNKTIKCPWVSSQTLEKILLFPSDTFTLRNRVSEKFRVWEIWDARRLSPFHPPNLALPLTTTALITDYGEWVVHNMCLSLSIVMSQQLEQS